MENSLAGLLVIAFVTAAVSALAVLLAGYGILAAFIVYSLSGSMALLLALACTAVREAY